MFDAALVEYAARASVVDARPAPAAITTTPSWSRPVTPECVVAEARRQSLEPWKLLAVMRAEDGRVGSFSLNSNGSYDMGPLQVNSVHLPALAQVFRVSASQLAQLVAYDGCFNVAVGAYLLRKSTNSADGDFWYGIGQYHSRTPIRSAQYMVRVNEYMQEIVAPATSTRKNAR